MQRNNGAAARRGCNWHLVWGFVGIPLAWGVIETVLNALKLFH